MQATMDIRIHTASTNFVVQEGPRFRTQRSAFAAGFFYFLAFFRKIFTSRSFLERFQKMDPELGVGELRKIRHPRNVKFDKVLETCFQEQETHDFREPGTCEASNS
jgi:hypothetical protein